MVSRHPPLRLEFCLGQHGISRRRSTSAVRSIESSDSISPMCLASARLQPKPSYARSAPTCPDFAMLPPLHPGWNSVLRTRSVVARCSIPRVAASRAALLLRYAWQPTRCMTQKIISASSFGASLGSSANPKPSPPPLTNSHALSITCSALRRLTTKPFFTAATKKLQDARNFGSADKPLNSGFKSSLHRTGDVPWESALLRLSLRAARRSAGISALRRLGRRNGTPSGGYSKFQILMRIPTRVGKQALSVQKIYRSGQIPDDRGFRSNSVSPRPLLVPCRRSPRQLRPRWLRGAGFFRH